MKFKTTSIEEIDQSVTEKATHINVFQKYALMSATPTYSAFFDTCLHVVGGAVDEEKCKNLAEKAGGEFKLMGTSGWMAVYHEEQDQCKKLAKQISGQDCRANTIMRVTLDENPFRSETAESREAFPYDLQYEMGNKTFYTMFLPPIFAADHIQRGGEIEGVDYSKLDVFQNDKIGLGEKLTEYRKVVEVVLGQVENACNISQGKALSFTGRAFEIAYGFADGSIKDIPVKFFDLVNPWAKKDRNVPVITAVFDSIEEALADKDGVTMAEKESPLDIVKNAIAEGTITGVQIMKNPAGAAKVMEITLEELKTACKELKIKI